MCFLPLSKASAKHGEERRPAIDGLRVLRISSVFEPPEGVDLGRARDFDPIGGMQNHAAELTRSLDRLLIHQTVITGRPPGWPARYRLGAHATVLRHGFPTRRFRQLYSLPAAAAVARHAEGHDVIHVHMGEDVAAGLLGVLASRLTGAPLVATIHCSMRHTFPRTGLRETTLGIFGAAVEEWVVRAADAVVVLTERLRALLTSVASTRVHVIPSGVAPDAFRGPFIDPIPQIGRPRVMYVGRLAPQKNVLQLVEAFESVNPNASLVLVGDGPERRALEDAVRGRGLEGRVHVTGFVPHTAIPAYLAHGDIMVMPSRYEELGSALLEACWSGLPIVAAATGGIPEVVRHESNGFLFTPGDRVALGHWVNLLLSDGELRKSMSAESRARSSAYSWHVLAGRIADIYRSVTTPRQLSAA